MSTANKSTREVINTRVFNFPPDVVFTCWSDAHLLAQWWGPKGFTNTFHEFNFTAGGNWKFTMHGPNGKEFPNESIFDSIEKPHRIVFTHLRPMHKFEVTATFEDLGDKTRLVFRMLFDTEEECNAVRNYVPEANEQNFDRLEKVLEEKFM